MWRGKPNSGEENSAMEQKIHLGCSHLHPTTSPFHWGIFGEELGRINPKLTIQGDLDGADEVLEAEGEGDSGTGDLGSPRDHLGASLGGLSASGCPLG